MRLWIDRNGSIVDDERVLAYIAVHGSLSAALEAGDIELLSESGRSNVRVAAPNRGRAPVKRLRDYLAQAESSAR